VFEREGCDLRFDAGAWCVVEDESEVVRCGVEAVYSLWVWAEQERCGGLYGFGEHCAACGFVEAGEDVCVGVVHTDAVKVWRRGRRIMAEEAVCFGVEKQGHGQYKAGGTGVVCTENYIYAPPPRERPGQYSCERSGAAAARHGEGCALCGEGKYLEAIEGGCAWVVNVWVYCGGCVRAERVRKGLFVGGAICGFGCAAFICKRDVHF